MAEGLALVDIGDMYLDDGGCDGTDGIVEGDAGVGVGSGIEDDAVGGEAVGVEAVDEVTLMVALVVVELYVGVLLAELLEVVFEGAVAIDIGLAATEEVEVGTVEEKEAHRGN